MKIFLASGRVTFFAFVIVHLNISYSVVFQIIYPKGFHFFFAVNRLFYCYAVG